MKKILFIDRDGTLILEPSDYQIDTLEKLIFYPEVITYLVKIFKELDYELILVTNQDGLGTSSFPENTFWPIHNFMMKTFENEGVSFLASHIDKSLPEDLAHTRKPKTGMLNKYIYSKNYDIKNSFVIGDRFSDMQLAKNLGCKGILISPDKNLEKGKVNGSDLEETIVLRSTKWKEIYTHLKPNDRIIIQTRSTNETEIELKLNLDGTGISSINTGIAFFDHMLDQIARHASMDLFLKVKGDLSVDEHHTIEDTAIVLGGSIAKALGNKLGVERYGFCLPMDDCLAQVAIDFGGRNWIVWDAEFKREMIGKMPTEMFFHFFKSFSDSAKANLNIKAEGDNEHHKIESIFKAFARAIKIALKRDPNKMLLPSTKGSL
ncbi:MAG: bifunctional histidinol-phosphatase/imidazoleglycerol-phosphate dehydratase HisB [Flavobacteriaceae bacterium]|nr:bifunctional histidinol-phosphatase/imidazoleglycerol-phosphate dehydratase HisB [Flavobacteriaceae bacterium]